MRQGHVARCIRYVVLGCLLAPSLTAVFPRSVDAAPPPVSFVELSGSPFPVGAKPACVAVGDLNGDGRLDVVTANFAANTISLLLGTATGALAAATSVPITSGTQPDAVAIGDLNGDGKPDLAVADFGSNSVSVLLGNGDGTFAEAPYSPLAVGTSPVSVAVGDLNGDRRPDIVTANVSGGDVSVLLADPNNAFQSATAYPVGVSPRSALLGDVDNDGRLDLLVANRGSGTVSVLIGAGDGTFRPLPAQSVGLTPHALAVGDLDGDARLDLVVTNYSANSVGVLLGRGDGTFTPAAGSGIAVGTSPNAAAIGDLNGDGKPDLVVANFDDFSVSILLGNGDGTFVSPPNAAVTVGEQPKWIAIGDQNGDGALDLVVANFGNTGNSVTVLRNAAAPPAATHLSVAALASGTAGAPFSLTVTARTATDAAATGYTGAVTFRSSDPKAALPAAYRFTAADRGVHTFSPVIVLTSGDQTITVADATTASIVGSVTIAVVPASTTLTLTSDVNPAAFNQPITFTATVSAAIGVPTPGETVIFLDTGTAIGGGLLNASGQATLRTTALGVGSHPITARYSGDGTYAPSVSAPLAQRVDAGAAASLVVANFPATITAGVAGTVTVAVTDAFGNAATGYTGTVHLSLGTSDPAATLPADYAFTNADSGAHTFPVTLTKAGPQSITATDTAIASNTGTQGGITVTNAAASSVAANAGATQQTAQIAKPFAANLTATVTDAFGNPVGGVSVTFAAPTSGASGAFANESATASASTDGGGAATAPVFTANSVTGSYAVTARVTNIAAPASFALANTPGPPGAIAVAAGASQSVVVGKPFPTALAVLAKDAGGNPVGAGIAVTFTAPAHGAGGSFAGGATATAATNASGIATAPAFKANTVAGDFIVTAAAPGVAAPARIALTNTPDLPAILTVVAGSGQRVSIATAFPTALAVAVTDASGNPIRDLPVTFTAPGGGASGVFAGGGITATARTDAGGIATAPAFTASGTMGAYTVTASATGIRPASFALANLAGPATRLALVAPAGIQARASFTLTVTANDASGNTASGYTGMVRITSDDPQAVLPADAALVNGVGAFAVTLKSAGSQHVTAADRTNASIAGSATVNVTSPPAAPDPSPAPNPVPTLTGVSPASVTAGGAGLTLTVRGAGFVGQSGVRWNDAPRPTTYISPAQLVVTLSADDVALAGSIRLTVVSPAPGGGGTAPLTFTVTAPAPPAPDPAPAPSSPPSAPAAVSPAPAAPSTSGFAPPAVGTPLAASATTLPTIAAMAPIPPFTDAAEHRFFAATGHSLNFGFKAFWEANGGIALFGLPLSEEFAERGADGAARTVQYFERARFEYHPEFIGTPYEVELGLLASEVTIGRTGEPPFHPVAAGATRGGEVFFPPTGHMLTAPFRAFWETNGGLMLFGLPISEPFEEMNADTGRTYLVQYFERYRMEQHPEGVALGRLGVQDAQLRGYAPR